jgi:predicted nucleic acid-binding protein
VRYVVDASVAVKWVVEEALSDFADSLLAEEADLLAPDFLLVEAGNALWKKIARREISVGAAAEALDVLIESPIEWAPSTALLRQAFDIAARLRHPVCDCLYLALAERESATLVTADDRLRHAARRARTKAISLRAV